MRLTDKSRYFRVAAYYYERASAATDPKVKTKLMKMAAWYRDRALEIDEVESGRGAVIAAARDSAQID
jgi:hypothetical protein